MLRVSETAEFHRVVAAEFYWSYSEQKVSRDIDDLALFLVLFEGIWLSRTKGFP